jgi:5-methylcytosine-specific restriction endonuclease McrA
MEVKIMKKICTICNIKKPLSMFYNDKRRSDGKRSACKKCELFKQRKHYNEVARFDKAKYRQLNAKKINAYHKKYRQDNPEKILAKNRKRKALKRKLDQNYSEYDSNITKQAFNCKCVNCNSSNNLTIDHHFPLSKGNPLSLSNAVVLCRSCNSSKGAKSPEDFYTTKILKKINKILSKF